MADLRSVLERADRAAARVPAPADGLEGFLRRRDRRRRTQRVTAGVAAVAVFVAAVWLLMSGISPERGQTPAVTGPTISPAPERVGFVGLPPEGATPSIPTRSQLVLYLYGGTTSGPRTEMWVYADGRLIWRKENAGLPYGANPSFTGYLEQRLSAAGVELLRSEVLSTGLFDESLVFRVGSIGFCRNSIAVRNGDRLVQVGYSRDCGGEGFPPATPDQADALLRLDARLGDPASWLPSTAWEDPEIRAYVPSEFALCYSAEPSPDVVRAARILTLLPAAAEDLLRSKDRTTLGGSSPDDPAGFAPLVIYCSTVTTEEARLLAESFDAAGYARTNVRALQYWFAAPEPIDRVYIDFEPIFPHGKWTCSTCG